jgi:FKBP-type peptidyl-prolyl cis-trans isomerase (trigger factor)
MPQLDDELKNEIKKGVKLEKLSEEEKKKIEEERKKRQEEIQKVKEALEKGQG